MAATATPPPPYETPPDYAPNVAFEPLAECAARTGYTTAELTDWFPPIERWHAYLGFDPFVPAPTYRPPPGCAPSPSYDSATPPDPATAAASRFPLPPFVHPRVFFGPDDLPALRAAYRDTHIGCALLGATRGCAFQLAHENIWDSELVYLNVRNNPNSGIREKYRPLGIDVCNGTYGFSGKWLGDVYENPTPEKLAEQGVALSWLIHREALRCLIMDDAEGGRRVGNFIAAVADWIRTKRKHWGDAKNWQHIHFEMWQDRLAFAYDFAYIYMTPEQQRSVRALLLDCSTGRWWVGSKHLPAMPACTSNWVGFHATLLHVLMAVEGEHESFPLEVLPGQCAPGPDEQKTLAFDPVAYLQGIDGVKKWFYVSAGPCGAPYEGLIKSAYFIGLHLAIARRGYHFGGSQWVSNHIRNFWLHMWVPGMQKFIVESGIEDVPKNLETHWGDCTLKYTHPDDPVIDFFYGAAVQHLYKPKYKGYQDLPLPRVSVPTVFPPPDPHYMKIAYEKKCAANPEQKIDYDDSYYDFEEHTDYFLNWLQNEHKQPLTYYSDYRGVFTTRSEWSRDGHILYMEPRNIAGGHTRPGRNEFVYIAQGRVWATRPQAVEDDSERHSVIQIDGKAMAHGARVPQGRTIAVSGGKPDPQDLGLIKFERTDANFIAGDATVPYNYHLGGSPMTVSPNDSRAFPSELPWMKEPWGSLPDWVNSCKGKDRQNQWTRLDNIKYVYRTTGLIRGMVKPSEQAYVLIVDDVRKDDSPHQYGWRMQVPADVQIERTEFTNNANSPLIDVILMEKEGNRRLLLRFLHAAGDTSDTHAIVSKMNDVANSIKYEKVEHKLGLTQHVLALLEGVVTASFIVMLYPFRSDENLPATHWNGDRASLTVTHVQGNYSDVFSFACGSDGRTRVHGTRKHMAGEIALVDI